MALERHVFHLSDELPDTPVNEYPVEAPKSRMLALGARLTNPFEFLSAALPQYSAQNRAFFKLLECLSLVTTVPQTAMSVCEAPGSFLQCIHAVWPGCALIGASGPNIEFDTAVRTYARIAPETKDITRPDTREELVRFAGGVETVDLYTADGSTGADRDKEASNRRLVASEIVTGLRVLRPGGSMVIKAFNLNHSRDLVKQVLTMFARVYLVKPIGSRPCNRESYLVCVGRGEATDPGITTLDEALSLLDDAYNRALTRASACADVLTRHATTPVMTTKEIYKQCSECPNMLNYAKSKAAPLFKVTADVVV
jgi:23S rRNA U2552 (ribose-2'-O)-methylase RlmE/FtsJ